MSNFYVIGEINASITESFFRRLVADNTTDVVISSQGGDAGMTYGLFDVIKFYGLRTHVVGYAGSAAAVLLQAGKWRTMTNSSLLLFHAPTEDISDSEMRLHMQLVEMVSQRNGLPIMEAHNLFDNTFINANRALELGLIDEIAEDAKFMRWVKDEEHLVRPRGELING